MSAPRCHSAGRTVGVVGAGRGGRRSSRLLADRGHAVTLAYRDPPSDARGDPRDRAATRATSTQRRPAPGSTATTIEDAPVDGRRAGRRSRCRAARSAAVVEALPRRRAGAQPDEGPRPRRPASGSRRSSRGRPVAVLSGPNMAEEVAAGLPGATVIASEDEELARQLQERDQLEPSSASTSTPT